ncbi:MAG: DUF58 domain-containing protein, partial [Chloroflexi bacterium]|nr:DUF58 domain-containing protein [Chloroflexota bacterium]
MEIANAKPLPLAWLKATDELPAEFTVKHTDLGYSSQTRRRILTNLMSLRWYELVRRRYRLKSERRGAFEFGPVMVSSGDIFGFRTRHLDLDYRQTILVYPKLTPMDKLGLRPASPFGEARARRRVAEDPLRLAGARDYQPGDSIRHIHWKATARRNRPITVEYITERSQNILIALDSGRLMQSPVGDIAKLDYTINA